MIKMNMSIKIDDSGFKRFAVQVDSAIMRGLQKGAYEVERNAKINAPYDTGTLMRSIKTSPVIKSGNSFSVAINPSVEYGEFMELPGNVRKRGMRPFMQPSLLSSFPAIKRHLREEIKAVLR